MGSSDQTKAVFSGVSGETWVRSEKDARREMEAGSASAALA